jgi:hypothetical protein
LGYRGHFGNRIRFRYLLQKRCVLNRTPQSNRTAAKSNYFKLRPRNRVSPLIKQFQINRICLVRIEKLRNALLTHCFSDRSCKSLDQLHIIVWCHLYLPCPSSNRKAVVPEESLSQEGEARKDSGASPSSSATSRAFWVTIHDDTGV